LIGNVSATCKFEK